MKNQIEYNDKDIRDKGCFFCCCLEIAEQILWKHLTKLDIFRDIEEEIFFTDSEVIEIKKTLEIINSPYSFGKVLQEKCYCKDPEYIINYGISFLKNRLIKGLTINKASCLLDTPNVKQVATIRDDKVPFYIKCSYYVVGSESFSNVYLIDKNKTETGCHFTVPNCYLGSQKYYDPYPNSQLYGIVERYVYALI